jgi:hypothetical protein
MTSGMTAFVVAVGGTSVICYLLMHRVPNRSARLERAGSDGSGSSGDGAGISCPGSAAATARLRTIPARPATREARTAEEGAATVAEVAVAAAINAESSTSKPPVFWSAAIRTF